MCRKTQNISINGKTINDILINQEKSQVWLAAQCNCTQSFVSQVINGKVSASLPMAIKISKALGLSVISIISE